MLKICLVSSTGGHYMQLQQLFSLADNYDYYILTEKNVLTSSITNNHKIYYLLQQERKNIAFLFKFFANIVLSIYFFIKELPDVVISTGAGATIPTCILTKLFRKKLIYIESFAKIDTPTTAGKIAYKFADCFYVQWEEMLKVYPKAIYKGEIY